ncbi:MAG: AI-2E family transporter, partial [Janthinobacterium lividum]
INTGMGVVIGLGLTLVGVPHPILWAGLAALLRFVPYVGAWIAALLATALAAAVDPGWSMAIWTLGLFVIAELIAGQIVEPMLYGHSTGLSPLSVIVAAIFWSWLWGPIGLILSTPLTLCLVVLGRHVDRLEFLDVLLGDRPALTPVQNFYQRMLAGDPDEALGQAEVLLRDRPLSAYYDEVAIKGLRLAANDVARGVVTDAQFERIRAAAIDLIDSLSNASDGKPDTRPGPEDRDHEATNEIDFIEPSASEQRVPHGSAPIARPVPVSNASGTPPGDEEALTLCIAGRGPLDDIAAKMMAQLLEKHGLRAAVVAHGEASRSRISELDISRVGRVCAVYLDADAVPSSVRYLLRRTRERLPQAPLVIGLIGVLPAQPHEAGDSQTDEWSDVSGSVWRVASLKEAIEACLSVQPVLTPMPKAATTVKMPAEMKTALNADGLSELTAPAIAAEASTARVPRQDDDDGETAYVGATPATNPA